MFFGHAWCITGFDESPDDSFDLFILLVWFVRLKREQEAGDGCTQHSDSPSTHCERWQMQRKDVDGQVYYTPGTGQDIETK